MLNQCSSAKRKRLEEQLHQLYNADDPASSIFRGCTTNPPLSLQAVQNDPIFWNEWYVLEPLFEIGDGLPFKTEIWDEVSMEVMEKLMKIPYCIQAYDPNGLAEEQFNDHPATVSTVKAFVKGFSGLEEYVMERKVNVTGKKPETFQSITAS